jgi:hypothetical protein
MPRDPFCPFKKRLIQQSTDPRVIRNRQYDEAKEGLEIALHREEANFRAAKSRKLKTLKQSFEWCGMTHVERQRAEEDVIKALNELYSRKKEEREFEWRLRMERFKDIGNERVSIRGDGEPAEPKRPQDGEAIESNICSEDCCEKEDEEWETCSEGDADKVVEESLELMSTTKLIERSGQGWLRKMQVVEGEAKRKATAWEDYKAKALAGK